MSQNKVFYVRSLDATGAQNGQFTFSPVNSANGVFSYRRTEDAGDSATVAVPNLPFVMTASVRRGTPHVQGNPSQRVKRKLTFKAGLPINVTFPDSSTVGDFVNVEVSISTPVEASAMAIRNAVALVNEALFNQVGDSPLAEMVTQGFEPY